MQKIEDNGAVLALVWRDSDWVDGLSFPTPDSWFVQVGLWQYPAGKKTRPHKHKHNERLVTRTQEGTFVKRGSMKVRIGTGVTPTQLARQAIRTMAGSFGFIAPRRRFKHLLRPV